MECPACNASAGHPYLAGTMIGEDGIRVGLRCQQCGHEWAMDLQTKKLFPPLVTAPKDPDLKKTS